MRAAMPGSEHTFIGCDSGADLGSSAYLPGTFYTPIILLGEFHLPIFGISRFLAIKVFLVAVPVYFSAVVENLDEVQLWEERVY